MRDDHSRYSWFYPTATTSADREASTLIDWCAAFGSHATFMPDDPTHFQNKTMRLLTKGLLVPHHLTIPYFPWSNGAVERLGKEQIRAALAVLSELQLTHDIWPQIVLMIQSSINNSPSPQRDNVCTITAFTGLQASTPIATILRDSGAMPVTLEEVQLERSFNVKATIESMDNLRPTVQRTLAQQRARMRECREQGNLANFCEGDFVFVARNVFHEGEQLCLRWRGPCRVTNVLNDYCFQVEDLRNRSHSVAHGRRLKFYHDQSLDTTAIISHVPSSETGMPVTRLLRLVDQDGRIFVTVRWKGLSKDDDTLEPLYHVQKDVPQLLQKLLKRKGTSGHLRAKAMSELGL